MNIETYLSSRFTSNSFLVRNSKTLFSIDCGSVECLTAVSNENFSNHFLLLTHYHYDHIYYLNQFAEHLPSIRLFASEHTIEGLYNPKLNLSFYHEDPIVYTGPEPNVLSDGMHIYFNQPVLVISTPGHNPGCLSYLVSDALFTGDAYIPFIPVVTKLKGGDRLQAAESLRKIKSILRPGMTIYPGHGPSYPLEAQVLQDLDEQINNLSPK